MNQANSMSYKMCCWHHFVNITLMPLTVASSLYSCASRIYYHVKYMFFKPSYIVTPADQARIDAILARVQLPKAKEDKLPETITVDVDPSLSGMVQQIAEVALREFTAKDAPELSNPISIKITKEFAQYITQYLIEILKNIELETLLDDILNVVKNEVNAHQGIILDEHKKKIDDAKQKLASENSTEQAYATIFLNKIYEAGKEIYLRNFIDQQITRGISKEQAISKAEGLMTTNANTLEEWNEIFLQDYLEHLKEENFSNQAYCKPEIKDVCGKGDLALTERLSGFSEQLSLDALPVIQPILAELMHLLINTPEGSLDQNFPMIEAFFQPFLKEKIHVLLRNLINPDQLDDLLAKAIFPGLIDGMFSTVVKNIIKSKWDTHGCLLVSYLFDPSKIEHLEELLFTEVTQILDIEEELLKKLINQTIKKITPSSSYITFIIKQLSLDYSSLLPHFKDLLEGDNKARDSIKALLVNSINEWLKSNGCAQVGEGSSQDFLTGEQMGTLFLGLEHVIDEIEEKLKLHAEDLLYIEENDVGKVIKNLGTPHVEYPKESFGEIVTNIFALTKFAETTFYLASSLIDIPAIISKVTTASVEPYLSSDKVLVEINEIVQKKFMSAEGRADPGKIMALKQPASSPTPSLEEMFELTAKIAHALILQNVPAGALGAHWAAKQIIGEDYQNLQGLLQKIQGIFFSNRVINLNRVERLVQVVFTKVEIAATEAVRKIQASKIVIPEGKGKEKEKN